MKRRDGYVSNSSSSSFVILNWKELDEVKRDMILHYGDHVLELWKSNGLPIAQKNGNDAHIDMDALPDVNPPDDVCKDIQRNIQWQREHEADFRLRELAEDLDFGWLDCNWRFREKDGVLDMVTSMDNFDMEKWLGHIGGVEFRWTGESMLGLFDDEEPKLDISFLERLAERARLNRLKNEGDEGAEGVHQDA